MGQASHHLTLEEHDWFLWGLWQLACGTDHGECLALDQVKTREGTCALQALTDFGATFFQSVSS